MKLIGFVVEELRLRLAMWLMQRAVDAAVMPDKTLYLQALYMVSKAQANQLTDLEPTLWKRRS